MSTTTEALRMALEALELWQRTRTGHTDDGGTMIPFTTAMALADCMPALRAALAASEAPSPLTDYELTEMDVRASQHGGGLHPWWMVLCRDVEKRVRQECALDKLAAESQRLGLYDDGEARAAQHTSERHFALREAHGHADEEAYFKARPRLDGPDERAAFRAGHQRGFDAAEKVYTHPPAPQQPAQVRAATLTLEVLRENNKWHIDNDDFGGYDDSALQSRILEAIHALEQIQLAPQQPAPAETVETVPVPTVVSWSGGAAPYRFVRLRLDDTPREYEYVPAPAERGERGEQTAQGVDLPPHPEHSWAWTEAEKRALLKRGTALASAPRVPQGWKLVPVEPTEAMVDATHHGQPVSDIYRDMLAAAPQPEGGQS